MIEVQVLDEKGQRMYTNLMNFDIDSQVRQNQKKLKAATLRENIDSQRSGRVNFSVGPPTPTP